MWFGSCHFASLLGEESLRNFLSKPSGEVGLQLCGTTGGYFGVHPEERASLSREVVPAREVVDDEEYAHHEHHNTHTASYGSRHLRPFVRVLTVSFSINCNCQTGKGKERSPLERHLTLFLITLDFQKKMP